ncbi:MAG TPA: type IX secretion system membrane protein PorP/SprF [Cyclobacteriaceae bacterium]|nr:type IX secretion system membrane protein PorP/SprF [Cyclobacteriaceae bacterium]
MEIKRIAPLMLITGWLLSMSSFGQQGPQFTQYMFNNLVINPAYAGADEHPSITIVARDQWSGLENAPSTQSFAAHTLVAKRVGLGLTVVHDRIGVHKNTTATANYAYHLRAGKNAFFSMGLQAGVVNFRSDYPSLAGNSNDPLLSRYVKDTKLNLGAGIYFRSPRLDAGFSLPGLLSRKIQVNDTVLVKFRNADVLGYLRYRIPLNPNFTLEPSALVKYFPSLPVSFDANCMIIYKEVISGGLSYRNNESVDMIIKLQLTPKLQVGYGYDYPVGDGTILTSASHELMLHYVFRKNIRNVASPR